MSSAKCHQPLASIWVARERDWNRRSDVKWKHTFSSGRGVQMFLRSSYSVVINDIPVGWFIRLELCGGEVVYLLANVVWSLVVQLWCHSIGRVVADQLCNKWATVHPCENWANCRFRVQSLSNASKNVLRSRTVKTAHDRLESSKKVAPLKQQVISSLTFYCVTLIE